jgi:hypothetical protein
MSNLDLNDPDKKDAIMQIISEAEAKLVEVVDLFIFVLHYAYELISAKHREGFCAGLRSSFTTCLQR